MIGSILSDQSDASSLATEDIPTPKYKIESNTTQTEKSVDEIVRQVIREDLERYSTEDESSDKQFEQHAQPEEGNEQFNSEVLGHEAFIQLRKDEVLFLDAEGRPVGKPQKFTEFVDDKPGFDGKYLYSPGALNDAGFPEAGIAGEWLDYVQAKVQDKYPEHMIAERVNVVADFVAAYHESDEPELVAAIASGEIVSYDQIVSYFAEKPVRGAEHLNRMEYAQQEIVFRSQTEAGRPAVPDTVQAEFRRILPGLFAHESKFNAGLTSANGAKGLAQIMPATSREYRGDADISFSMIDQLDVAGKLISDNYHYITHFGGEELLSLRDQYESEEEFEIDLIVPLMVLAYNVGGPAVGLLIKDFAEHTAAAERTGGKDLFIQFRDYAQTCDLGKKYGVGVKAGGYVPAAYGNLIIFKDISRPKEKEDMQLAQN